MQISDMLHFYGIKEAIVGVEMRKKISSCLFTVWVKELLNNEQKGIRTSGIKKIL